MSTGWAEAGRELGHVRGALGMRPGEHLGPRRAGLALTESSMQPFSTLDREIKQIAPGSERPPVCGEKALDKLQ